MKRIYARLGDAVVRDVAEPGLRPGEILVDTSFSTVSSGTESLILRRSVENPGVDEEYPGSEGHWPKIRANPNRKLQSTHQSDCLPFEAIQSRWLRG